MERTRKILCTDFFSFETDSRMFVNIAFFQMNLRRKTCISVHQKHK